MISDTFWKTVSFTVIGLALWQSNAVACADGVSCAVIRETSDGFVALRSNSSSNSQLLLKLIPYEIIVVVTSDCDVNEKWTQVASVPRIDGDWDDPVRKTSTGGWVRSSLLAFSNCPQGLTQ